jgi:ribonuclease Z
MLRHLFPAAALLWLTMVSPGWAEQPSDMQLILLGTGYPFPSADRAGPSCAIIAGQRVFIVDSGRGTTMRLAALGNLWRHIGAVFITHMHSDHIDGLPDLFHSTWEFGGGTPFELYGPEGIKKSADAIIQFYEADIHIRRDLTEKLSAEGARINAHEIQEGVVYEKSGVRVTAFQVEHPPVKPAFGYRFDSGSQSIVVTGDTKQNPNLIKFAAGADILVSEAYVPDRGPSAGPGERSWSIQDYHMSAKEAGETAEKAKVKTLVLTHLIPANAPEKAFLDEAGKAFSGKIIVGRDLMHIKAADTTAKGNN